MSDREALVIEIPGLSRLLSDLGVGVLEVVSRRRGARMLKVSDGQSTFALKVVEDRVPPGARYSPALVLRQEASVLERIQPINEGYLIDHGVQGEIHWLLARWIDGHAAGTLAGQWRQTEEPDHYRRLLHSLIVRFFGAVTPLHALGFVHGDLQPGHLLVTDDGSVRLIDYGLGKHALTDRDYPWEGGPAPYLPPEVALKRLEKSGAPVVDTLAEVYSAVAVAFTLYTGFTPINLDALEAGPPEETFRTIAYGRSRTFGEVGAVPFPKLEQVLLSCLATRRADRCASLRDALALLQEAPGE